MKKYIYIIMALVVIVGIIAVSTSQKQEVGEKIKIGIVLPLTGPAAALGEASKQSAELALANLSVEERAGIELVYADDQFDAKQTVSVTQKLIDVDKVNALITYSSASSVAASYVAEKSEVPMIGLGNASDISAGKKWVQKLMLGPEPQAKAIEEQLLRGKYKKIAIIWNQTDGPKSVHDSLVKILAANSEYVVVADESVAKGENDFKTSIAKIKAAKPDVVVAYISPQVGVFAKQAQDLKLGIPLVSGPVFEIVDQLKAAQGGLDNQLYLGNDNTGFIDQFYTKYGVYPTIAGDYLYDAITHLAKGVKAGNTTKEPITQYLRKDFSGVAGDYKYNGDGSFDVVQVVKKWDGTKFVVVK